MNEGRLKFAPAFQSFVDTSFFHEFSNLKLEILKLDSQKIPLYAKLGSLGLTENTSVAHIFLNSGSLKRSAWNSKGIQLPGWFFNFNTFEEFKILDKTKFLYDWTINIWKEALNGSLNSLFKIFVIGFADLKRYNFYYWVAIPVFQTDTLEFNLLERRPIEDKSKYEEFMKDDTLLCGIYDPVLGKVLKGIQSELERLDTLVIKDTSNIDGCPTSLVKNFITIWKYFNSTKTNLSVVLLRNKGSFVLDLSIEGGVFDQSKLKVSGWERNINGKLTPKLMELASLIDSVKLADQSIDLNLKLMKWRLVQDIDLDIIKNSKALLLGAGTLGCNVARSLLAWGVRTITFVDNGTVSLSNPVRQSLYKFSDNGLSKAEIAAKAIKDISPSAITAGVFLEVLMVGHPVTNECKQIENYEKLHLLIKNHDIIFLLMDSRETRWLPTVLGNIEKKLVINAALGFDSYLVMRHGNYEQTDEQRLGCYFCHDVVAPTNSLADRTLDQMCTVTRPGVAMLASALAVEMAVSVLQHSQKKNAPPNAKSLLGLIPHQIRGFLNDLTTLKLESPAYKHCSACSRVVVDSLRTDGWEFLKQALNNYKIIEELSGLSQIQKDTEKLLTEMDDINFETE